MRLIIEPRDFKRLSRSTQEELLQLLSGRGRSTGAAPTPGPPAKKPRFRYRSPVDLTPELTARLMHGINAQHKERLRLFAESGGRVELSRLLAAEGAPAGDVRALSHFEGAVTRRLRRILGDREKVAYLIGWDYESTVWNEDTTQIVDGVYYVTDATAACLRAYFQLD